MSTLKEFAVQALEQAINMNKLAEEKEWDKLEQLQIQHSALVEKVVAADVPDEGQDTIQEMLLQVQALNTSTSEIAKLHQVELVKTQKTQKKANKMQKALHDLNIK